MPPPTGRGKPRRSDYLANSYFACSARLTADAADVIGEQTASAVYRDLADRVAALTWSRWRERSAQPTRCAVALQFEIVPSAERTAVGDMLSELVDAADGRVSTGFLGTPLVLPALSGSGKFDSAYRMLLRSEVPSWLYQLTKGATTVWERWDAIRPDGSIHPGTMLSPTDDGAEAHMLSFNHYAYGAVIDWVYRHVAGIAPDPTRPGYRHVIFAQSRRAGWTGRVHRSRRRTARLRSSGLSPRMRCKSTWISIWNDGTFHAPSPHLQERVGPAARRTAMSTAAGTSPIGRDGAFASGIRLRHPVTSLVKIR